MSKAPFSSRVGKIHQTYTLKDGVVIPGVTTVLAKEVPGDRLAEAAANLTREGIVYRDHWRWLADIGTLAHSLIFHHLMRSIADINSYSQEQIDIAENCLLAFMDWEKAHDLEIIFCEQPMVSEFYEFGGTPDICGILDGLGAILDIKTGLQIYANMWFQLAAYKILAEENYPVRIRKLGILNLGRDESEKCIEGYLPSRNHKTFDLYEMYFLAQLKALKIEQKILARN